MSGMRNLLTVFLAAALVVYPLAGRGFALDFNTGPVPLKTGDLSGLVADPKGGVLGEVPVSVLDKNGTMVASVMTDAAGQFMLNGLSAGDYTLAIGNTLNLNVRLADDAELSKLKIIAPKEEDDDDFLAAYWIWFVVGGVVIIIAILIPLLLLDGGGGTPMSGS